MSETKREERRGARDPNEGGGRPFRLPARLFGVLLRSEPARWAVLGILLVLLATSNGVGLVLLVPLLHVLEVGSDGAPGGISAAILDALRFVGLEPRALPILAAFVGAVAIYAALEYVQAVFAARLQHDLTARLRADLWAAAVRAPWVEVSRLESGDLFGHLSSEAQRAGSSVLYLVRGVAAVVVACVHLAIGIALAPAVALIGALLVLAIGPVLARQDRMLRRSGMKVGFRSRALLGSAATGVGGLKLAKSFGVEERHATLLDGSIRALRDAGVEVARAQARTALVYRLGTAVVACAVLAISIQAFAVPAVDLVALTIVLARGAPRVREAHAAWQNVLYAASGYFDLEDLLERLRRAAEREKAGGSIEASDALHRLELESSIELRNVSFEYPGDGARRVLEEVDLEFPRGSVSALVGPSGAGKTTLADLLLGLIAPTSGTVLIDARALDASLRARWRRSTAYAPQEPYLFAGTLRENLLWACPGASDHELEDALRDAGAKHLIDSGAGGLDREVGERGSALSGGERQRVAIARALLRAPSFLVLDEPTSALDSESEREVVRTIAELRGKVTIVIVAHRPGIVCAAERIVELVGGRVVRVEEREALAGSRET